MKDYDKVMEGVCDSRTYPMIMHGVPGMLSRPEAQWLHRIPSVIGDGLYIELGTFRGRSTCILADTMKSENLKAKLITIDTFDDRAIARKFMDDGSIEVSAPSSTNHFDLVQQTFEDKGLLDYITMVKATTVEAAGLFTNIEGDFLFIDADHSYAAVKKDFTLWKDKLKPDGIIAFHDSHRVDVKAVHAEITDWEEFDRVETLSVWRRCDV